MNSSSHMDLKHCTHYEETDPLEKMISCVFTISLAIFGEETMRFDTVLVLGALRVHTFRT